MSQTDTPADTLGLARRTILAPGGLDEQHLDRTLGLVMDHAVDAADLYFQVSREESWALEDGIVKEGSASIEEGVGVRAIAGEKTGFAYSDEIQPAALEEASRAARAIAKQSPGKGVQAWQRQNAHSLYLPIDPLASMEDSVKIAWLEPRGPRNARDGSAHRAGDGQRPCRARDHPGGQFRGSPCRRRAAAGALQCVGAGRAGWPARAGLCRRRRPLHAAGADGRRSAADARPRGRAPGAGEPRGRAGARGPA